ncbi:MAG TPA: dihydrolipoyl dehydrogenase [Candidatus Dormibacteraeota bacterium]|nr:dihydrolipoyl dehydrogenase [Candidatus Dormibacteraeota bacterium]
MAASSAFDVAVLGGGTGGYTAAIRAAQLGKKTAVIEVAKLGGTCLHIGCIPTKALLESSGLYHKVHDRGPEFGITAADVGFDYERIAKRRDGVVNQLWKGVQGLMKKNRIEVVQGCGVLEGEGRVRMDDRTIQAGAIIVATGSSPRSLPGIEFDGQRIINSDHATLARELPGSIAIIGAGAVGVEFATFYRQMGVDVTLIEALDRLVPLEDEEVSRALRQAFEREGIDCRVGARVRGARAGKTGVTVQLEGGEVRAEQLLIAVGRGPNSRDIGLDRAGVELDERGFIRVDEWMRTSAEGVWAIGDVVGGFLLAHAAAHEGVVAAEDIAGERVLAMEQDLVTRCTYSTPEIASVGLTEAQARERGLEVKTGKFPFVANARALIHGESAGFAKLVADAKTGQLLGAHVIGVQATELIGEPALARLFQGDAWEVGRNIHPHPTLSEVIGEAALAADGVALNI